MDTVSALAKLLSDRSLRESFCEDRPAVAASLCEGSEAEQLSRIDPAGLRRQAELLLNKRERAIFPMVRSSMTGRHEEFLRFADTFWPEGHHRHHEDALHFLEFLGKRGLRYCLGEYLRLASKLRPRRLLLRMGFAHTPRGWRPAIACQLPGLSGQLVTIG